jgi:hypothetical protein
MVWMRLAPSVTGPMTYRPEPSVAMMVAGIYASESAATSDSGTYRTTRHVRLAVAIRG